MQDHTKAWGVAVYAILIIAAWVTDRVASIVNWRRKQKGK